MVVIPQKVKQDGNDKKGNYNEKNQMISNQWQKKENQENSTYLRKEDEILEEYSVICEICKKRKEEGERW